MRLFAGPALAAMPDPSAEPPRRRRAGRHRHRRAAVAVAALVSLAGLLPFGHSPVTAAAGDVETQRLRGPTRYETAVAIAEEYVDEVEHGSSNRDVDRLILASGGDEHFGYVLPAPALAARHDAPVLLTTTGTLPGVVRSFITNHRIRKVFILGGTGAVSEKVAREVDALSGVSVERISGDGIYATSAKIAAKARTPGELALLGRTVFLATGENFADALAVGPLAYRGDHPILLTRRTQISQDVLDYIDDTDTEHVVILGGTAAVSRGVESAVQGLGVRTSRWQGASRVETALEIAGVLLGSGSPESCFDGAEAGLALAWRHPDAIVSGPYLGELCAPLLLTDRNSLPAAVRTALADQQRFTGDSSGRLRITAFGGTAAIAESVIRAAVEAAELDSLDARVTATEGACHFTVAFDEPVLRLNALNARNYFVGASLLSDGYVEADTGASVGEVRVVLAGGRTQTGATAPTGCRVPLRVGDEVGVAPSRIHAAEDLRRVKRAATTVRRDTARPRLTITAPQGAVVVLIDSNEPIVGRNGSTLVAVEFSRNGLIGSPIFVSAAMPPGATRIEVAVPADFDVIGGSRPSVGLLARDTVAVNLGEVQDLAGNQNLRTARSVVADNTGPRLSAVTVTPPTPVERALAGLDGEDSNRNRQAGMLQISTVQGSAADGAAGNDWGVEMEVIGRRPTGWASTQNAEVSTDRARRSISIRALSTATLGHVESHLNRDEAFSALFTARVLANRHNLLPVASNGMRRFAGGASTVDLKVLWTEPVRDCDAGDGAVRPGGIEIDVNRDGDTDFALDGTIFDPNSTLSFVGDNSGRTSIAAGGATCDETTAGARSGTLVARLQAIDSNDLPSTRSSAYPRPNAAYDLSGNPNQIHTAVVLRRG